MERRDGWIVQQSGPSNSLGLVKFDLANDQAIYLHDTPAKSLFARPERHASHGCVRVFDALGFARMIASDEGVLDQWDEARATGEESYVPLPHRIPVRLYYQTAYVEDGRVVIAPDVYGWDEDVAEALGLPRRARPAAPAPVRDLGP
jgi:murein L,D-transpeptidase YcbB/YkuD